MYENKKFANLWWYCVCCARKLCLQEMGDIAIMYLLSE